MPNPLTKLSNMRVNYISLVGPGFRPINGRGLLYKGAPVEDANARLFRLVKADEEQHLIFAVAIEADQVDSEGEVATAQDTQDAAYGFMEGYYQGNVDFNHDEMATGCKVVESFLLRGEDPMFPKTTVGSWCVVIHVTNVDLWDAVKRGEIVGVSVGGWTSRSPLNKASDDGLIRRAVDQTLKALGLKKSQPKPMETEDMTDEQLKKILEDALKPVKDRLTKAEEAQAAAAEAAKGEGEKPTGAAPKPTPDGKGETDADKAEGEKLAKAVATAIAPLTERLERLEKSAPGRRSDPEPGNGKTTDEGVKIVI